MQTATPVHFRQRLALLAHVFLLAGAPSLTALPLPAPVAGAAATAPTSAALPAGSVIYLPVVARATTTIYWGALVTVPSADAFNPGGAINTFEARANKHMSILHWGQSWKMNGSYQAFDKPYFDNVRNHGSLPVIDWASRAMEAGASQPEFTLSAITAGNHDNYIRAWATAAKTWGHPFFLRFDWEMNGDWQFPWSEQLNSNQPGDYIKAWRHVHDIFAQVGATNVTWVWCPNISSKTTLPLAGLYPGDSYVDWTCLDGYNKETQWMSFNTLMTGNGVWLFNSYQEILTVAPYKRIMIGETASLEAGDGGARKAAWITEAFTVQIPRNFPMIGAVLWFNGNDGNPAYTFPIESSQPSIDAFAASLQSSYYAANTFGQLAASPIQLP